MRMLFKIKKPGCVIVTPNTVARLVIPNHASTNGTHAIGGTDRKKLKNGSSIRFATRLYPISIPSGTATIAAIEYPNKTRIRLTYVFRQTEPTPIMLVNGSARIFNTAEIDGSLSGLST